MPLPQVAALHTPALQNLVASPGQGRPSAIGVRGEQVCAVASHVLAPAHASVAAQLRAASPTTQVNLQVTGSQPSPEVALPSSHSSVPFFTPSPHETSRQVCPWHSLPSPHEVPSAGAVPDLQTWSLPQA